MLFRSAGGATAIVVPEVPFDIDELASIVTRRHARGRYASVVVVAEGARPKAGTLSLPQRESDHYGNEKLGDLSHVIGAELSKRTGYESRVVQLGHIQRGGTPTSYDRVLATRFGLGVVDLVHQGAWGKMVALKCGQIVSESMSVTRGKTRFIDRDLFDDVAKSFFG